MWRRQAEINVMNNIIPQFVECREFTKLECNENFPRCLFRCLLYFCPFCATRCLCLAGADHLFFPAPKKIQECVNLPQH